MILPFAQPRIALFAGVKEELAKRLENHLRETGDPRVIDGGDIYESYERYSAIREFPPQTR